jgi:hypothetical protein
LVSARIWHADALRALLTAAVDMTGPPVRRSIAPGAIAGL